MVLAAPDRAWRIALVATLASVLGGYAGYGIGAFLYDSLGAPLLAWLKAHPYFAGTPRYAAPEQLFGEGSPATDWYAVGTMLFE